MGDIGVGRGGGKAATDMYELQQENARLAVIFLMYISYVGLF